MKPFHKTASNDIKMEEEGDDSPASEFRTKPLYKTARSDLSQEQHCPKK